MEKSDAEILAKTVLRALKVCNDRDGFYDACMKCPYYLETPNCFRSLRQDSIAVIEQLRKE